MAADVIHRTVYVMHAVTGVPSLLTGYVAFAARKGSPLHRRSGILFVCTMLAMWRVRYRARGRRLAMQAHAA